jgi:hypothetical protein
MADKELQQAGSQALLKLPAYLKRGIDPSKLEVVQGPPEKAYGNHDAIASIDPGNHNRIIVHDRTAFLADPNSTAQVVGHELSHAVMDTNPSIYKPITGDNPYDVDLNNLQGKKLSDLNQEQIANVVQNDIAARTQPGLTPQRRQELIKQFSPITDQIGSLKPGTINNDQTGQVDNPTDSPTNLLKPGTMNTTPNAPQPMFDAMPAVTLPASGPLPQSGSQGQSDPYTAIADQDPYVGIADPTPTTQQVNQQALRTGLVGAAKGVGDMLVGSSPLGTAVGMIPAVKRGLEAKGPDEMAGKIAANGVAAAAMAGPDTIDGLVSGLKSLTSKLTDQGATSAMHGSVNQTAQKIADELGVKLTDTGSVRDPIRQIAEGVRAKGQSLMDEVSHTFSGLTGPTGDVEQAGMIGDYDQIGKDIIKKQTDIQKLIGPQNMEKRAAAVKQLEQLQANQKLADNMLEQRGLSGARQEAARLFKQADDLDTVSKSINTKTTGLTPKMQQAGVKGTPERINGQLLGSELEKHYQSGVLQNAVGEDHAHQLISDVNTGGRMQRRSQAAIDTAKQAAKRAVAYGVGDTVAHGLEKAF